MKDNIIELDSMSAYIKAIYKILQTLEKSLDDDKARFELFTAEHLKISKNRWLHYLLMLQEAGYIQGVIVTDFVGGDKDINIDNIAITLKGLEYLASNNTMRSMSMQTYKECSLLQKK